MGETVMVIGYDDKLDYHLCQDSAGNIRRIDLMFSGCLDEKTPPNDLVGKTIYFESSRPYIELAEGVNINEQ